MPANSDSPRSELPSSSPLSADEMLPPVEPPDASFILQLFVVPAVIVAVVLVVSLLLTSMAGSGEIDPKEIVAQLRSSTQNRWQQAFELANALRTDQSEQGLRGNTVLADELAKLLDEERQAANDDDNSIKLRTYLAASLGAFQIDNGLEVLLKTARDDSDLEVRRKAINAIAVLADTFAAKEPPQPLENEDFVETMIALANDKNDIIRTETAFALGVIVELPNADPRLSEELDKLVDDLYPYARLNAALGLARQGNIRALGPLTEMLDLESLAVCMKVEADPARLTFNRNTILKNVLDAAVALHEKNPDADLSELKAAIEGFIAAAPEWKEQGTIPPQLVDRAKEVLKTLQ